MKSVKISFKTEDGKYELHASSEQVLSVLADDLFTTTSVDSRSGKFINHGNEIVKALKIEKEETNEKESPE